MKSKGYMLLLLIGILFVKGYQSGQVEVQPTELLVLPGQNATFMCRMSVPLQYCRVEIPSLPVVNLNLKLSTPEVSYHGAGLDAGQCGFTINRVSERMNGVIKCTLGVATESTESVGTMQLIVARRPDSPILQLSRGTDSLNVYKLNDQLVASCVVKNGRPVANITWFLDNEQISRDGLSMPSVKGLAKEDLQDITQNLTRTLQATDNGKLLKCVAQHPAYPAGTSEAITRLDVRYGPLPPEEDPIDKFGYKIGQADQISIEIESNPKPQIEWMIDGQRIREGSNDNTGRMVAEPVKDLGPGKYEVTLRIAAIKKEDTEKVYKVIAYNDLGTQEYRIKISTSAEPEGDIGLGGIIGIVAGVLVLLLLIFILIFARVSGRWCFKPRSDRAHIAESSDTESTDVRPTRESRRSLINLTAFFKKNKEKPLQEEPDLEPREPEQDVVKIPLDTEEKINTEPQTDPKEGLVYAELDLVCPNPNLKPVVKKDDEKTEYAEIVYTTKDNTNKNDENKNENKDGKKDEKTS